MTRKFISVLTLVLAMFIGSAAFANTPNKPGAKGQANTAMAKQNNGMSRRSRRRHRRRRHHRRYMRKAGMNNKTNNKTNKNANNR